ncbi:MAG: hypothetical protein IPM66_20015 [Acidobacteriota bacterium]|nr:MAG: hypothetical protein IPM66_20015 [Acidobacteriota bacterium]
MSSKLRIIIAFLALLLIVLPSGVYSRQTGGADGAAVTREQNLRLFEQVWRAILDNYYDRNFNGIDWRSQRETYREKVAAASSNEELFGLLRQMIGALGDAHTRIYSPDDAFDRYRPAGMSVGVTVRRIEGRPVVSWVEYGSEAWQTGVRPGFIVSRIDGRPVDNLLARIRTQVGDSSTPTSLDLLSYDRLFYGARNTAVTITFLDHEKRPKEVSLKRRFTEFQRRVVVRQLPFRIGYIELTGFGPEIEREFEQAMLYLNDTQGIILDLRNNGGGFVTSVAQVASYFFPPGTDLGEFITRQGRSTRRRTQRVRTFYRNPVVILVSGRSASGSEILAAAVQERGRGLILGTGETTCGCLLGVSRTLKLIDGWKLNISDSDYRTAMGRRIEGAGIRPDLSVDLTTQDLIMGRDRALESAVDQVGRSIAFRDRAGKMGFTLSIPTLSEPTASRYQPASQFKN